MLHNSDTYLVGSAILSQNGNQISVLITLWFAEKMKKTMGETGKTQDERQKEQIERERESEEINRNIERRGPEKPCVGFVNGKLKLRLDILLISERDYFTSNQNTYFICFSCFIHTQTGRNSHTHTHIQTIAAAETESRT